MHIPVLQKEVLQYLNPKPNENFIDCTIGEGGHTLAILKKNGPNGKVLGVEWDYELFKKLLKLKIERLILVNDSYINFKKIVEKERFQPVSGILFDLGLSSWHLEESGRGFSFKKREPLDMRYNIKIKNEKLKIKNNLTAGEIVNKYQEKEIEKILREYGEEKFSKRIAQEIVKERSVRPITNTFQLVEIIKRAVPVWYQHQKIPRSKTFPKEWFYQSTGQIDLLRGRPHSRTFGSLRGKHFATRTFQALRIVVNDELENLKKALPQALEILEPGGRLIVISFHSLEDRIIKNFFKENQGLIKTLTKKPIRPTIEEIKINPRCRSAKLRAAILTNN